MSLVQLFVPAEVAHDTVAELGELGNVEFKDVSSLRAPIFSFSHTYPPFRSSTRM
jgi:hypothetical protein